MAKTTVMPRTVRKVNSDKASATTSTIFQTEIRLLRNRSSARSSAAIVRNSISVSFRCRPQYNIKFGAKQQKMPAIRPASFPKLRLASR